jgi:hypothetical protein
MWTHAAQEVEFYVYQTHVKWVPYQHGMARPQVVDREDGLKIWRVKKVKKGKTIPTTGREGP